MERSVGPVDQTLLVPARELGCGNLAQALACLLLVAEECRLSLQEIDPRIDVVELAQRRLKRLQIRFETDDLLRKSFLRDFQQVSHLLHRDASGMQRQRSVPDSCPFK